MVKISGSWRLRVCLTKFDAPWPYKAACLAKLGQAWSYGFAAYALRDHAGLSIDIVGREAYGP